jgi:hypothetical protein
MVDWASLKAVVGSPTFRRTRGCEGSGNSVDNEFCFGQMCGLAELLKVVRSHKGARRCQRGLDRH